MGFAAIRLMSEDLPAPVAPKNNIVKLEDGILILYQFWDFDNISISKYSNLINDWFLVFGSR